MAVQQSQSAEPAAGAIGNAAVMRVRKKTAHKRGEQGHEGDNMHDGQVVTGTVAPRRARRGGGAGDHGRGLALRWVGRNSYCVEAV